MSTPSDGLGRIEGLVEEVAYHLSRAQINADRMRRGEAPYFSQMVSLSGDLLWTTYTKCYDARRVGWRRGPSGWPGYLLDIEDQEM
jgi:hypothetical protein